MRERLASENYLKVITSITLHEQKPLVRLHEIARRLSVSAAAVSDMVKKLVKAGWVVSHGHQGIKISQKGLALGKKMIRHHRLWETFLHQSLGLGFEHIHDEAERLEHASSDVLIDQLEVFLEFPTQDPHGNPIPNKQGVLPASPKQLPLSNCQIGQQYRIERFVAMDPDFLTHLHHQGLRIGCELLVEKRLDFDQSLLCRLDDQTITLSTQSLAMIYVSEKECSEA
ncbi:MAG: metal-dependent transcriptional regulator [bacterium]